MDAWIQPITYSAFKRLGSYTISQTEFLLNFLAKQFVPFLFRFFYFLLWLSVSSLSSQKHNLRVFRIHLSTHSGVYPGPFLAEPYVCISQYVQQWMFNEDLPLGNYTWVPNPSSLTVWSIFLPFFVFRSHFLIILKKLFNYYDSVYCSTRFVFLWKTIFASLNNKIIIQTKKKKWEIRRRWEMQWKFRAKKEISFG